MKVWRVYYTERIENQNVEVAVLLKTKSCEEALQLAKKIDPRFGIGHYYSEV